MKIDTRRTDGQTDRHVHVHINVGVINNCRYDSSNLFIIILMNPELTQYKLGKHVPINVGVKNDYRYRIFNLVFNGRLFLITLILSSSCCFCFGRA